MSKKAVSIGLWLLLGILQLLALNAQGQNTIRVPSDFPTIQEAINIAANGDTVLVASGTYVENINFIGKAITVTSEGGPEVTIIDGNQAGSVVTFSSGEGQASVLHGFTLQNGNSTLIGGGILISGSSPTITDNKIINNTGCEGAGIGIGFASPIIQGNIISNNTRTGCSGGIGGGGILVVGAATAQILDNVISNNIGGDGISLFAAGTPTIRGNIISGNQGCGISMGNGVDALIVQNLIYGNSGSGIYWLVPSGTRGPLVVSNTIVDNDPQNGSGIFADGFDDQTELINNIIVAKPGQIAVFCGDFIKLNPPIFRFNNIFSKGGTAYGGICADQTGINGNISADPLFIDSLNQDYMLDTGSPSVDAGDNSASELPATDLNGYPRIVDGDENGSAIVDMGAYEFLPNLSKLQFSSASINASETCGSAVITVKRKGGTSGMVAVDFGTSDGTAKAGIDYVATSGTLTFSDGETSKNFSIPIINDSIAEGKETVHLTLTNATGGAILGRTSTAVLTITEPAEGFFPATPGDRWVYQIDELDRFTTKVLEEAVVINGVETKVFENSDRSQEYYSVDNDGLRLHRMFEPNVFIQGLGRVNLTVTFIPPIQLSKSVIEIGETFRSSGIVRTNKLPWGVGVLDIPYEAIFTVESLDRVSVIAGEFDVVRLQGTVTIVGQSSDVMTFELAEGVGRVRWTKSFLGVVDTFELMEYHVGIYDLAVTKISAPTTVTLTAKTPVQTKQVKVEIQNRSAHSEVIQDIGMLANLVSLTVESLGPTCPNPVAVLHTGAPQKKLPLTLGPKKKLVVVFDVTFDCANDGAKSTLKNRGHEDFRYLAVVNHAALDGIADTHPADDVCPRNIELPGKDPNPDGTIKDLGCGNKRPDNTYGADVLTDVVLK